MTHKAFHLEMEKIAKQKDRSNAMRAFATSALSIGAGAGSGYVGYQALKKFNLLPKRGMNGRAAILLGVLSGGSAIMASKAAKDYFYGYNKRKNRSNKNVLPANKQLAERHERHYNQVPTSLLYADGSGPVPVYSRQGPIFDGDERRDDRADNNRRGDDRYRYRGKKARNYRFKDPFRLQ